MRIAAPGGVEAVDRLEEEALPSIPVEQAAQAHSGKDRLARLHSFADRFHNRTRSEREAAKVEIDEPEVSDQLPQIPRQDALWIMVRLVRLAAQAVGAKVGRDDPEAGRGDPLGMTEIDPVHQRIGKQAVEQDHRASLAKLTVGELDPVGRGPDLRRRGFAHPGNSPVASTHLLTSFG